MKKKTILIVDDDRSVADSVRKLLEAEKFNVLVARDGMGAVGKFRDQPVDLVLLDVNLGDESGWDLFVIMQDIKPHVPTIVVTAEFGQRDQAIAAGAEALIEKPINVTKFLELVHRLLGEASVHTGRRAQHDADYCQYIAKDHDPFLLLLQERQSAPLDLSTEMTAALPNRDPAGKADGSHT